MTRPMRQVPARRFQPWALLACAVHDRMAPTRWQHQYDEARPTGWIERMNQCAAWNSTYHGVFSILSTCEVSRWKPCGLCTHVRGGRCEPRERMVHPFRSPTSRSSARDGSGASCILALGGRTARTRWQHYLQAPLTQSHVSRNPRRALDEARDGYTLSKSGNKARIAGHKGKRIADYSRGTSHRFGYRPVAGPAGHRPAVALGPSMTLPEAGELAQADSSLLTIRIWR